MNESKDLALIICNNFAKSNYYLPLRWCFVTTLNGFEQPYLLSNFSNI